ncbi:hypothetical protein HanRHA438_Chr16g0743291 [Helianthus annuus]|nr:hypothetical protein HanIR_Chr16g0794781 [Helianthus annuus]KAJ0834406.1 hypothetical protein HanRHA438_Chr16g0743291 [Helianthus annuus]
MFYSLYLYVLICSFMTFKYLLNKYNFVTRPSSHTPRKITFKIVIFPREENITLKKGFI